MFQTDYQTALAWIKNGYQAIMIHPEFPGREHDPRERWLVMRKGQLFWRYNDGQILEAIPKSFWDSREWIVKEFL